MSKDLHLNGTPVAGDDNHLLAERSFDGVILPFDHEAYRRDLRKMTDLLSLGILTVCVECGWTQIPINPLARPSRS